jgi:hypothetical protein
MLCGERRGLGHHHTSSHFDCCAPLAKVPTSRRRRSSVPWRNCRARRNSHTLGLLVAGGPMGLGIWVVGSFEWARGSIRYLLAPPPLCRIQCGGASPTALQVPAAGKLRGRGVRRRGRFGRLSAVSRHPLFGHFTAKSSKPRYRALSWSWLCAIVVCPLSGGPRTAPGN